MRKFMILAALLALAGCSERRYQMPTGAMIPTIAANGWVLADVSSSGRNNINRWDLVVFRAPDSVRSYGYDPGNLPEYVMRVLGLPGDTVEFGGQAILINGKDLPAFGLPTGLDYKGLSAVPGNPRKFSAATKVELARDEYFIVGDRTETALDSRFLGPLPKENIIAKVLRIE